ncbi:MAG: hypothetical protein JW963_14175 [Anaerolineales bacterium]|nr:hypothetical protein [Anaerolineales bacterium]
MAASEKSVLGFAKQAAKGAPASANFKYLLFSRGTAGVQNMTIPLDQEVGGGAMLRDVVKVGVTGGGALEFIPRPDSLGLLLMGATGQSSAPTAPASDPTAAVAREHVFTLGPDQFAAPYYTARFAPAKLWGEEVPDCRFTALSLQWRGANFIRGQLGFVGGTPVPVSDASAWGPQSDVDQTPPFITPVSKIEMPSGVNMKVLGGSFMSTMAIPLEEQWIVGSYSPDDFDIVSRAFVLQLAVKVADANLYNAVMYDGLGYANAWSAEILKQADFNIEFKTGQMVEGDIPYSLKIEGNGGAPGSGNVAWSAQPVGLRAGSQVVMNVTGVFLADATQAIKFTLVNGHAAQY